MSDDDAGQIRRAALSIGLYVAIASAVIIAAGVGLLVASILFSSRREGAPHRDDGHSAGANAPRDDFVVDADRIVPLVLVLGIVGVLLLGLVAWFAARRSVQPLGDALRRQRNFVADASHELRTPLTTLTSRIQVVQRRHSRGEPIDDSLADLRNDAAMMGDVLNDLLLAAEEGALVSSQPTEVAAAAAAAVASLRTLADESGVALVQDVREDTAVSVPTVTLVRVIMALIDNAVQHSPTGETVTISLDRERDAAMIRVIDRGSGITGITTDQVFERFARSAQSGRRRGFGLGLSLVRDVAVRAGGTVEVEKSSGSGTTFLLRLPAVI